MVQYENECYENGTGIEGLRVEECFMTKEEFNNLPEFEGF